MVFLNKIGAESKVLLYRQLAALLSTGVELPEALAFIVSEERCRRLKKILKELQGDLAKGGDAGAKLSKYPQVFPDEVTVLFKRQIPSCNLAELLYGFADEFELSADLQSRLKIALFYPFIVSVAAILLISMLMMFVVPIFSQMFADMGGALPAPTQFVVEVSDIFKNNSLIVSVLAIFFIVLLKKLFSTPHILAVFVPAIKRTINQIAVKTFSKNLALLLKLDIPLNEAVGIAAGTIKYPKLSKKIKDAAKNKIQVNDLKEILEVSGIFPQIALQMVAVGIKSGDLIKPLLNVSTFCEKTTSRSIARISPLMHIFFLLLIGGIIGFVVISMYLPIFQMGSVIG